MLNVLDSPATRFAQEAERRRIARELHDSVVQSLTALVADLEYFRTRCLPASNETSPAVAAKVETWQELARDSLMSMRRALGGLRVPAELEGGLESALQTLVTELRDEGYCVQYECADWPELLPFEYTSNLYYIVQEALTNIRKHAQASTVRIAMFSYEGHLHLSIGDNGKGIAASASPKQAGCQQGLIGLRERVILLAGRVSIESSPARGTRIDVDIPLEAM
jgi:two-component system, NarL family, sensor histidine kinase DegS